LNFNLIHELSFIHSLREKVTYRVIKAMVGDKNYYESVRIFNFRRQLHIGYMTTAFF